MSITSKELADILNVSPATVSMVLNNKQGISEETRDMVLKAAKEYDLQVKKVPSAKSKLSLQYIIYKKSGEVVGDTPFFSQVTEGIIQECQQRDCTLKMSYFYGNDDFEPQFEEILKKKCSGILLLGTEMDLDTFEHFKKLDIPLVLMDCYHDDIDINTVLINNTQGAYAATNNLIKHGHKKIGYLKSKVRINNFKERADGYYKALRQNNIPFDHPYVLEISPEAKQGYIDMCNILQNKPELATAYFADNDIVAAAAIRAFKDYNYKIPDDISVIGFDDMPECQVISPPLSTMNVDKKKLGALAVSRLTEVVRNIDGAVIKLALSTQLVERESVKTI